MTDIDFAKFEGHTPGPWFVGPTPENKYDDWGMVRGADHYPVANTCAGARFTDEEANEARRTKTTPPTVAANAALVAAAPTLLAQLTERDETIRSLREALKTVVRIADDHDKPPPEECTLNTREVELVRAAWADARRIAREALKEPKKT